MRAPARLASAGPLRAQRYLPATRPEMHVRDRLAVLVAVTIVVAAAGAAAWILLTRTPDDPAARAAAVADDYLKAWQAGDWAAMRDLVRDPLPGFVEVHQQTFRDLGVDSARLTRGPVTLERIRATIDVTAELDLDGGWTWSYPTRLVVESRDGEFAVIWSPATLHPRLEAGLRLDRRVEEPERAPITAHDGTPLAREGEVADIGIEPRRVRDPEEVAAAFAEHTGVDPDRVRRLLARDDLRPDWFYPVVRLQQDRYRRVRPSLFPVPGIVFRTSTGRVTPSERFAHHVLGRTGEVTAELLEQLGPAYQAGDVVGLFGLERAFERQLAGDPTLAIVLTDADGEVRAELERFTGDVPEPVRTTLDPDIQAAADEVLDGVAGPAALVAVDARTGAVRAAASRPLGEFDRALAGLYPPGSAFKVVTAAAALASGVDPAALQPCPAETVVGGLRIGNAGGMDLGEVPLREAFARSCNTTFAGIAATLDAGALGEAAATFGFGSDYELPLEVAGGRFPDPSDLAERAAAAIGQARVQASPLHMATVAAAVAGGTWRAPHLLAGTESQAVALQEGVAARMREFMRQVVRAGTGTAADVPGTPVAGKTGSAEVSAGGPTHAWFIGFRGTLAFAVLVEEGGAGGEVAAPLAAQFLTLLDGARS